MNVAERYEVPEVLQDIANGVRQNHALSSSSLFTACQHLPHVLDRLAYLEGASIAWGLTRSTEPVSFGEPAPAGPDPYGLELLRTHVEGLLRNGIVDDAEAKSIVRRYLGLESR